MKISSGQDPSIPQNGGRALVLASLVEPFKAIFLRVFGEFVAGILCYIPNVPFNRNRQTYRDKSSRKNDDRKKKQQKTESLKQHHLEFRCKQNNRISEDKRKTRRYKPEPLSI